MLSYSDKLEKYVRNNVFSKILLDTKRYRIYGSFKNKIPYITDIDVVNTVHPEINKNNIYQKIIELIERIQENKSILLAYILCGTDHRFDVDNGSEQEIKQIKNILDANYGAKIDEITQKYGNDKNKMIYYLNELLRGHQGIKWSIDEIKNNSKTLPGNITIMLTDAINSNYRLVMFYYVKIGPTMIGVDVSVIYDIEDSLELKNNYGKRLANTSKYSTNYFDKLYSLRNYFKMHKNNIAYKELEDVIENKFGLYKQLMNRINIYRRLYDSGYMTMDSGTDLVKYILRGIPLLPNFTTNLTKKINETNKLYQWKLLLQELLTELDANVSIQSKDYFFKYLDMLPLEDKKIYYENNTNQNRIKKMILY